MKPVLCFGDICPDFIIPYGAALAYRQGSNSDPDSFDVRVSPGGSVANTCSALARLGVPVMFCGAAGDDSYGHMLYDDMKAAGADVSLFKLTCDRPTMEVLIVVDERGERFAFAYPRHHSSQHYITSDQLPDDIEHRISWLHCGGITLREDPAATVHLNLMRRCKAAGIPVSFDINARLETIGDTLFASRLNEALTLCDVLMGSAIDELCPLAHTTDPETAAQYLSLRVPVVISRRGQHGAVIYANSTHCAQDGFHVPVVDTVGAGDMYNAGYIFSKLHDGSEARSNRIGCAVAAFGVTGPGGKHSPTVAELEEFLEKHKK